MPISRDDLSYLEIGKILKNYRKLSKIEFINYLKICIDKNKNCFRLNNYLVLPSFISSEKDFDIINLRIAKPNFITQKSVTSNLVNLDKKTHDTNFNNKIILLEHADPGFDWIFTRNPSGLITKYGGVASHMSIRCSELRL